LRTFTAFFQLKLISDKLEKIYMALENFFAHYHSVIGKYTNLAIQRSLFKSRRNFIGGVIILTVETSEGSIVKNLAKLLGGQKT